jgi:endoglucanase
MFTNPMGVATGSYSDGKLDDEMVFAGMELFISTGDASYKPTLNANEASIIPAWPEMYGLAVYGAATHPTEAGSEAATAKTMLNDFAKEYAYVSTKGFGVVMSSEDFVWGSNAVAGNQGVFLLHAYYVTGDQKYYEAAKKVMDYLLGKNPLDMSFVTGFGTKSPLLPHHRPSTSDNVEPPVPGMVVGGPQPNGEDIGTKTWECKDYTTGKTPATSYIDDRCSYATNEVAINWNAPFAYLAGALEALNAGYAPSFAVEGVAKGGTSSLRPLTQRNRANANDGVRLRFNDQKLYVEMNGKRFDLKGHLIE